MKSYYFKIFFIFLISKIREEGKWEGILVTILNIGYVTHPAYVSKVTKNKAC